MEKVTDQQSGSLRERLKRYPLLKRAVISWRACRNEHGLSEKLSALRGFYADNAAYRRLPANPGIRLDQSDLFPRIHDKTSVTRVDPVYFIQGTWCARKIFENKPKHHYDIGSQALMVGIIAQFTPTTMVDIRPLEIKIPGLHFLKGDITALPFADRSLESLSSICVIEHIGLGRYGDPLDQFGTEKAAAELMRVVAPRGSLYISVPIDRETKTYFNAHRAFTREYIVGLFKGMDMVEEKYIYGNGTFPAYDAARGFGTGLYHFRRS